MKKLIIIIVFPLLFLVDVGIYLTIGGHWKTIRQYSKNKLKIYSKVQKTLGGLMIWHVGNPMKIS